ncbi:hypothetical protein [Ramlibacter sp.]|uniref:hypothetical protein n=1 Tax=Ramlibacter sp. TaxID=1917967 RepID=UPI002FC83DB1
MNPLQLPVGMESGPAFQALAHNGLVSHAQEWHLEWQRAQARAWLHATPERGVARDPPCASHGGTGEQFGMGSAGPDSFAAIQLPAVQTTMQVVQVVQVVHAVQPASGAAAVASYAPPTPRCSVASNEHAPPEQPRQPEIARDWRRPPTPVPCQRETVHRTVTAGHEPRTEKDTVRLHVEYADDGLRVWIGADGDAAVVSARAAAILAELRRSAHVPSLPLASVVCNGRTLYASSHRAAFPLENPP